MAKRTSLTRSSSASSASTLSCINVAASGPARESSVSEQASQASTAPTTVTDGSTGDPSSVKQEHAVTSTESPKPSRVASVRRSVRAKSSVGSFGSEAPSDILYGKSTKSKEIRDFSGATLVNDAAEESSKSPERRQKIAGEVEEALDMDWKVDGLPSDDLVAGPSTKSSRRDSTSLGKLGRAASKLKSTLGKRGRDAVESGMEKLGIAHKRQSTRLQEIEQDYTDDQTRKTDSEEPDRDAPAGKKAKLADRASETPSTAVAEGGMARKTKKPYMAHGLYLGFTRDWESTAQGAKTRKKHSKDGQGLQTGSERTHLPYLMGYKGELEGVDFRIPYDIFAPQKLDKAAAKSAQWKSLSRNVFIGDAKEEYNVKKLKEHSACHCRAPAAGEAGCDDDCLNRIMFYECDETNCNLPAELCSNRAFSELSERTKRRRDYDVGIEIVDTKDRGFGIRANRPFGPGQIIVEYCGEVITQEESDRRMHQVYKDKACFYLMEFDQGMIIDATKGNIARFVNHSCEPNCSMEKRIVRGEPKMALFAGPRGIATGEELTYDYNFDNFSSLNVLDCRCGAENCRGKLERRDAKKDKERKKESLKATLKRKVDEFLEASVEPADAGREKLKKRKTSRAIGWCYEDPTVERIHQLEDAIEKGKALDGKPLADLKQELSELERGLKRAKKEPSRPSSRASSFNEANVGDGRRASRSSSMAVKTESRTRLSIHEVTTEIKPAPRREHKKTSSSVGSKTSMLARASSLLARSASTSKLNKLAVAEHDVDKPKVLRQSTLNFHARSITTSNSSILPVIKVAEVENTIDDGEDEEEILLNPTELKKSSSLRRAASSAGKKVLGSLKRSGSKKM